MPSCASFFSLSVLAVVLLFTLLCGCAGMRARRAQAPKKAVLAAHARPEAVGEAGDGEFVDPFADPMSGRDAASSAAVHDPLEKLNRTFFTFNRWADRRIARPVARGYSTVTPKPLRECVERFFINLQFPIRFANCLFVGHWRDAGVETCRFITNSTAGIGGLFDTANRLHLPPPRPADLDRTLGRWGARPGPYLCLPILGPSSVRGVVGRAGDTALDPVVWLQPAWAPYTARGVDMVNTVAQHGETYDAMMSGMVDPYVALRSAYLESRAEAVRAAKEKNP